MWFHMHAGKRPCGPFCCDDVAQMQVEGLNTLENAAVTGDPEAGFPRMCLEAA
jgi:hypothetical protein